MISIILSIGAINAFIPLIIILILIVAAAGLMRGYNIFALFGISALLGGAGKATLTGKNVATMTAGFRQGSITRNKATALEAAYIQKTATKGKTFATKGKTFAKYYKQEYSAARANGVSRVEAAKIASSNARIRMMQDKINTFQSSLNNRITIYDKKTNKQVNVSLIGLLGMLKASSALKNDTNAQNLVKSIISEKNKLDSLASQANQIQLNRTSAAAAKANLNIMRQIQKNYKETSHNFINDLHRFERRYHEKVMKEGSVYYSSKFVNFVTLNRLHIATNKPSALTRDYETQAHEGLHRLSSNIEKASKS